MVERKAALDRMHLRLILPHHPFKNADIAFIRQPDGNHAPRVDHDGHIRLLAPLRVFAVRGNRVAPIDLLALGVKHVLLDAVTRVGRQIEHRLDRRHAVDDLVAAGIHIMLD